MLKTTPIYSFQFYNISMISLQEAPIYIMDIERLFDTLFLPKLHYITWKIIESVTEKW